MLSTIFAMYWLLPGAFTWLYTNETMRSNDAGPSVPTTPPRNRLCESFYPSELRIMNSRYANLDDSLLHNRKNMFMLLRQRDDTFQIATQVQFSGITAIPNSTCHLHFALPGYGLGTVAGPQPIFNVYQVKREIETVATWNMFEANNITEREPPVFGQVNGTEVARAMQWKIHNGVYDIGPAKCNETLTFQMGMAFNGGEEVNYWNFINVAPPAHPAQGFKLVTDC